MKGKYPTEYLINPNVNKPIEEIWNDIDSYSGEYFEDEKYLHEKIDFFIPLPPLKYKGKITKGIFFSQALEYVLKLYPRLKEIFFCGAYTMWSSYSWCDKADFYLSCYENKPREEWHKNKYQNKKDIIFVPLQDADFTNEYYMAPTFYEPKKIDVLTVSSLLPVKNLQLLAVASIIYERKYKKKLRTTAIVGNKTLFKKGDGGFYTANMEKGYKEEFEKLISIIKSRTENFNIIPWVDYKDLPKYYSSAKCCVLASLIEGKNRSINEAMSCNTPIIVFKQHNQWARGEHPIFFGNSGELVDEFNPEALADTIYKVIHNQSKYSPRENYLRHNGRKNFINTLVHHIPYYTENIPEYSENNLYGNLWVDLAMQENYQIGFHDFLYGKNSAILHVRGLKAIDELVKFFYSRFGIK
ncbi:glycosyltransferase [bacterium]|nr:glycosyltransferase [bacterium]